MKTEPFPLRDGSLIVVPKSSSTYWDRFILKFVHNSYAPNSKMTVISTPNQIVHIADEIVYIIVPKEYVNSVYNKLSNDRKQDVLLLSFVIDSCCDENITNRGIIYGNFPYSVLVRLNNTNTNPLIWINYDDHNNMVIWNLFVMFSFSTLLSILNGSNIWLLLFLYEVTIEYHFRNRHDILNQFLVMLYILFISIPCKSSVLHNMICWKAILDIAGSFR